MNLIFLFKFSLIYSSFDIFFFFLFIITDIQFCFSIFHLTQKCTFYIFLSFMRAGLPLKKRCVVFLLSCNLLCKKLYLAKRNWAEAKWLEIVLRLRDVWLKFTTAFIDDSGRNEAAADEILLFYDRRREGLRNGTKSEANASRKDDVRKKSSAHWKCSSLRETIEELLVVIVKAGKSLG